MNQLPTPDLLEALTHAVSIDGLDAHRDALGEVVRAARARGIRPVLTDVLADGTAPRPARERALGLLVVALAAPVASSALATAGAASAA